MYYNSLDLYFAKTMISLCAPPYQSPLGALLCRLLSFQIRNGHVCLDREDLPPLRLWPLTDSKKAKAAGQEPTEASKERELVLSKECLNWLNSSPIVSCNPEAQIRPLVWESPRLYLYRYYAYERKLRQCLLDFSRAGEEIPQVARLQKTFESVYPSNNFLDDPSDSHAKDTKKEETKIEHQKLAVLLSALRPFLIISGAPGTGKTSTLARILELNLKLKPSLRIALSAPTGKAAMRIQQSLGLQKLSIEVPIPKIPTLQSLLGQSRDGLGFYHNEKRTLPLDLLLIDEASMLDLGLLARTLAALGPETRLILLGDHHQLASVESGAVMGELCSLPVNLSPELAQKLEPLMKSSLSSLTSSKKNLLTNSMVVLEKNFRFGDKSGIAILSKHIRSGNSEAFFDCLENKRYTDIHYYTKALGSIEFEESIISGFAPCFAELQVESILRKLQDFCVLSPLRKGQEGTQALNIYISQLLRKKALIDTERGELRFCPILICQNDYELSLFNGDMGLLCRTKEKSMACFIKHTSMETGKEMELREIPIELLPAYEMGFAMTVHRSQGSEFRRIVLLVPSGEYPLITRELLYTALTRARQEISLFASKESLTAALANPIKRNSGLLQAKDL